MSVEIGQRCLVSKRASIVGDVKLGDGCSVWPFASVRGDRGPISIGDGTSVQDCCVIHCEKGNRVKIGRNVTLGHGAVVHGGIIGDDVIIGMNAVVLDDAEVGTGSIIGAGAMVPSGMKIPEISLVVGVPARIVRSDDNSLRERARANALAYRELSDEYLSGKREMI